MKLHLSATHENRITHYGSGFIVINQQRIQENVLILPEKFMPWNVFSLQTLSEEDFIPLLELDPAVVLLGTGTHLHFLTPKVFRPLINAGIGYEIMNTRAACRTYNILSDENRRVCAALMIE